MTQNAGSILFATYPVVCLGTTTESKIDMDELKDLNRGRTNICFYHYVAEGEGWDPLKLA